MDFKVGTSFFAISAFILMVSCIVYYLSRKKMQKKQSIIFFWVLINIAISSISTAAGAAFGGRWLGLVRLAYISNTIYFAAHSILPILYSLYIIYVNGLHFKQSRFYYWTVFVIPVCVIEFLVLTNPITEWIFSYSEDGLFVRGPYEWVIYMISTIYLVLAFYYLIYYKKGLTNKVYRSLWYFYSLSIIGILIQLFNSEILIECFLEAISLMGIMVTIESEDGLVDPFLQCL